MSLTLQETQKGRAYVRVEAPRAQLLLPLPATELPSGGPGGGEPLPADILNFLGLSEAS